MTTFSKPSDHISFSDEPACDCSTCGGQVTTINVNSFGTKVGTIELVWNDGPDMEEAFDGHHFFPEDGEMFNTNELRKIVEYMESIPMLKDE